MDSETNEQRIDELRKLISGLCDGELQPREAARLEELVAGDAACCEYYVTAMHINAALPRYVGATRRSISAMIAEQQMQNGEVRSDPQDRAKAIPAPLHSADSHPLLNSAGEQNLPGAAGASVPIVGGLWSSIRPPIVLGLLVALLAGGAIGWSVRSKDLPTTAATPAPKLELTPVAFLASDEGCSWGADSVRLHGVGSTVDSGDDITLYEGTAEFRLSNGVSLSVEGPSSFVINSPRSVALQHGRMTVYVPEEVKDFRMLAGMCRITAQRAEWGVYLAGNQINIHSFYGEVLVSSSSFQESLDAEGLHDLKSGSSARREKELPSGSTLTKAIVGARRALSLVGDGDSVGVTGWSGSRSSEFAVKLSMGGELPITRKYVESVLATKPIGYWRFEQLADSVAKNEIADGIDLRVAGNVRLAGKIQNRVLDFTQIESSAYLMSKVPMQALAGTDYSVEVWMKPSHFHRGGLVALMENPELERGRHGLLLETHGAIATPAQRTPKRLRFLHRDPPASDFETGTSCTSASYYRVRRWQHVVVTKKGPQMRLHVNGQLAGTAKDSSTLASDLFLVLRWTAGVKDDRFFFGQLDELAIYNRALEKAEIESHYNSVRWSRTRGAEKGHSPDPTKPPTNSSI